MPKLVYISLETYQFVQMNYKTQFPSARQFNGSVYCMVIQCKSLRIIIACIQRTQMFDYEIIQEKRFE